MLSRCRAKISTMVGGDYGGKNSRKGYIKGYN